MTNLIRSLWAQWTIYLWLSSCITEGTNYFKCLCYFCTQALHNICLNSVKQILLIGCVLV